VEIWKPVVGYEGLYEVSNQGNVRSVDRTVKHEYKGTQFCKGKMLKAKTDNTRRMSVGLSKNGKTEKNKRISHLVAEAFIGPRPVGLLVLHGEKGVSVNTPENLSYGTHSKNQGEDKLRDGTDNRGEKQGRSKLTKDQVIRIKNNKEKRTTSKWAKEFNVSPANICAIKTGRSWAWLEP